MSWKRRILRRWRYRVLRSADLPKGNLTGMLLNLAARGFEPRFAIDVGANRGDWSRSLRRVFPECRSFLIEPQIEMKPHLDAFCARNDGCAWLLAGAGAAVGESTFHAHPDTVSSRFRSRAPSSVPDGSMRTVKVVTLDHVVDSVTGVIPDVVKIDAEGWEREVLAGASRLLGHTELVFLEAHFFGPDPNPSGFVELTALMDGHGYVPYDFTWFGKRPYDGALALCEIAFVRRTGPLRKYLGWT